MLLVGASSLLVALWDLSDQTFGSTRAGGLTRDVFVWLFDTFGHWGPRVALIALGVSSVAFSFWLASLEREDEAASKSGTKRFAVLSWTLILLVLLLLIFIVVGPLLRNAAVDSVLSQWRERYSLLATGLTFVFVCGFWLRVDWKKFRETGDPWELLWLLRPLIYVVIAISLLIFSLLFSLKAVFGIE
jgi:hypothetical protein